MNLNNLGRIDFLIPFCFSLLVSSGILIIYFKKPNFLKKAISIGIAFFILLFIAIGIWQSISTYNAWKGHPIYKISVPPINSNYFYGYCFFHYFSNFLLSIGAAILLGLIFFVLKKKNFVEVNEIFLVVLGTIIVGSPNFIIFLPLSFLIAIFFALWQNYTKGVKVRTRSLRSQNLDFGKEKKYIPKIKKDISLIFPLLVSLIFTILAGDIISNFLGLSVLRI